MRKLYFYKLVCAIVLLWNHPVVLARDVIQPYISGSMTHDSNLFRLSEDRAPATSDTLISRIEAGVKVDYLFSRQQLFLKGSVNSNKFEQYEYLNYEGHDWQSVWNWQVGNLWQGNLGYTRNKTLASFAETQVTLGARGDVRTQQSLFANANYRLHPDWRLNWGGRWQDLKAGSPTTQYLNREETSGVFGVDYLTPGNNSIGVQGQFIEARFPEREITAANSLGNGYSQITISSVADWKYSGNSRFRGNLGYTQRQYDEIATRDFNGMTGRLTYDWSITGKTLLSVAAWREVGGIDDIISTFAVTKGASLDVSWSPTSKIYVTGGVAHRSYEFRGDSGFVLGVVGKREDEIRSVNASLGYSPLQNIQLSLGGKMEQRDSNRIFVDYNYKLITASIRVNF